MNYLRSLPRSQFDAKFAPWSDLYQSEAEAYWRDRGTVPEVACVSPAAMAEKRRRIHEELMVMRYPDGLTTEQIAARDAEFEAAVAVKDAEEAAIYEAAPVLMPDGGYLTMEELKAILERGV